MLWFSRTRELHANRFSGRVTQKPNGLASALVTIAYGFAGTKKEKEKEVKRSSNLDAVGSLGIFDPGSARALGITAYGLTEQPWRKGTDEQAAVGAMQWDMWNPWARWHEFHSTHPLVARRLNHLGEQSAAMGQEPYVVFDRQKPQSYWREFLVDFLIYILPGLAAVAAAAGGLATRNWVWLGIGLLAVGAAWLVKIWFRYRGKVYPHMNVVALLHKVKVSTVRPVPVTLRGRIIGKGVPGLIWSEDFVMQDDTGIMFLDYRQPFGFLEWIFGLLKAGEYIGRDVEVTGWYRRSPVPYVEIKTIASRGRTRRCHARQGKAIFAAVMMIAGIILISDYVHL